MCVCVCMYYIIRDIYKWKRLHRLLRRGCAVALVGVTWTSELLPNRLIFFISFLNKKLLLANFFAVSCVLFL